MEAMKMYRQARYEEPLIYDLSKKGRRAYLPPKTDVSPMDISIPESMKRKVPPELPELHEGEVM
ncbi:MAG: aminomethyl-transferring glycine dehydrogenase subunit GcvPB, partial [Candidatus Heimdallarchaeota archaeon]|nr:aminomethyl-transferring glycine dehydrogenase subunit GcvPB [Candidatus Heimdallarchaeota archaeon]